VAAHGRIVMWVFEGGTMDINLDAIDEVVLALLHLNLCD
jgi:hypothetical protein